MKFNIGDRVISTITLSFTANKHCVFDPEKIFTVKVANEKYFSVQDIDLVGRLSREDAFDKCDQADGHRWHRGGDKFLNLDREPETVVENLNALFESYLDDERRDSANKIQKFKNEIEKIKLKIAELEQKSNEEEELEDLKTAIFKRLGL